MSQNSNYGEHIKKYMEEISTEEFEPLTKQQEIEVLNDETLSKDEKAEILVRHNVRLVSKVARNYTNIAEYDDMMQEGILGLQKAVETFDPSKGNKFCTYAYFYVFKAIQEYLKRENRDFSTIRNHSGLSFDKPATTESQDGSGNTNNQLENMVNDSVYTSTSGAYNIINTNETTDLLSDLLQIVDTNDVLDERERHIINSRFLTDKKRTLKDIGSDIGLSHSMVKLVQDKAIDKLKNYIHSKGISREDFEFSV
jgi:RNA polymerase sporulation-specific sigma factor